MIVTIQWFNTYKVFISKLAEWIIPEGVISDCLVRHKARDYGIISMDDWEENEEAVRRKEGFVLSRFEFISPVDDLIEFYVITYFDKKNTQIILIEE